MIRPLSPGLVLFVLATVTACGDDSSDVFGAGGAGSSSSAATGTPATSSASGGSGSSSASSASTGAVGSTSAGSGGEGGAGTGGQGTGGDGTGGSGTGGQGTGGGGTGGDGSGGQGTGGGGTGGGGSGGGGVCIDPAFEPDTEFANTEIFTLYRGTATGALEDVLSITVLASGTGDFAIADENLDACSTCVLLRFQCDQDSTACEQKFYADAGTVRIDTVGEELVGELIDVHLYEVTVDDGGTSTPVPGGETRCIESYAFDTPTTPI